MKRREENQLPQEKDRHLDTPSEANRDKHINFLEIEEGSGEKGKKDEATKERQKQWREGIEEGKRGKTEEKV